MLRRLVAFFRPAKHPGCLVVHAAPVGTRVILKSRPNVLWIYGSDKTWHGIRLELDA